MPDESPRFSRATLCLTVGAAVVASGVLSAAFMARSAFDVDGRTYFSLFDDAMISMRYARNLAGGYGLVWNPHEAPVEGYSNLLWTLWMAVLHLLPVPEPLIPLAVMITGAILLVGNVVVVGAVSRFLTGDRLTMVLTMALTALYYPLVYWTLRGMEVGFLTFLISCAVLLALRIGRQRRPRDVAILGVVFAAAALTRDDALVPILVTTLWIGTVLPRADRNRVLFPLVAAIAIPMAAVAIFRQTYYHALVPNTYHLKVSGVSLWSRLSRGLKALVQLEIAHLLAPTIAALLVLQSRPKPGREFTLLSALLVTAALYSVYVGGDAWEWMLYSNRYITPVIPLLLVLASAGVVSIARCLVGGRSAIVSMVLCAAAVAGTFVRVEQPASSGARDGLAQAPLPWGGVAIVGLWLAASYLARRLSPSGRLRGAVLPGLMGLGLLVALDLAPISRWLTENGYHISDDASQARTGLALRSTLAPRATVAVVAAGTIPYYSRARSIDLLGKNDPVIARLPSHLPFFPGHSKWDYAYSLGVLLPDVIQMPWCLTAEQSKEALATVARLGYLPMVAGLLVRPGSGFDPSRFRQELYRIRR